MLGPVFRLAVEDAGELGRARQQVETGNLMHDAGKHRRVGIHIGHPARDHLRQGSHMRRVLPQLVGLGLQLRVGDLAADLAHDQRRHQRLQGAHAQALHGRAHAGNFSIGTVVGYRVGNGDGACRQQGIGLDQLGRRFDMAIGIAQGLLQMEGGVDIAGERQFPPARLSSNTVEGIQSVHRKNYTPNIALWHFSEKYFLM